MRLCTLRHLARNPPLAGELSSAVLWHSPLSPQVLSWTGFESSWTTGSCDGPPATERGDSTLKKTFSPTRFFLNIHQPWTAGCQEKASVNWLNFCSPLLESPFPFPTDCCLSPGSFNVLTLDLAGDCAGQKPCWWPEPHATWLSPPPKKTSFGVPSKRLSAFTLWIRCVYI